MLRGTSLIVVVIGATSLTLGSAHAAVTVLGNGLARVCYSAAEFDGDTEFA